MRYEMRISNITSPLSPVNARCQEVCCSFPQFCCSSNGSCPSSPLQHFLSSSTIIILRLSLIKTSTTYFLFLLFLPLLFFLLLNLLGIGIKSFSSKSRTSSSSSSMSSIPFLFSSMILLSSSVMLS